MRSTPALAVFPHATPLYALFSLPPRQTSPPCLQPVPRFTAIPAHYPVVLCNPPRKTSTHPASRNSNPIDPPASAPPAAHFKRLYRNCPAVTATPLTPAWGSHDRVLTFLMRLGTDILNERLGVP